MPNYAAGRRQRNRDPELLRHLVIVFSLMRRALFDILRVMSDYEKVFPPETLTLLSRNRKIRGKWKVGLPNCLKGLPNTDHINHEIVWCQFVALVAFHTFRQTLVNCIVYCCEREVDNITSAGNA